MKALAILGLAAAAALSLPAMAEQQVTCASKDKNQTFCDLDTRGEVRMVRKLSNSPCIEGESWGVSKSGIWVKNGCRAVFSTSAGGTQQASTSGQGGLVQQNAVCGRGIEVHIDDGGPVYVNGKEAKLKRVNPNYFEATDSATGTTVSIMRNPDGTQAMSYTGRNGANGVCQDR